MIAALRRLWARAPWLLSAFALAIAITLFFGTRMVRDAIYWADPRHQDQPIAGWMTPGYVSMSWDVPREVMLQIVPPPEELPGRPRLELIAEQEGVPVDTLIAEIEAAIRAYREGAE